MNVLNDPWLFVEYINGYKTQVSIRKAFEDAELIKDIDTPIFHSTKVFIYDVPVIQLLVTILEAAYFKPEHKFKSSKKSFSKELMKDGWDKNILNNYFDRWQDRFNLFDDKYPFLQEIKLKKNIVENPKNDYCIKISPIAPALGNLIFENTASKATTDFISKYMVDIVELIYILLYNNVMGTSPAASQFPNKALMTNATMFIVPKGKNLKETLIYNCLPLITSSKPNIEEPDIKYDKPIWEFNSKEEILEYDMSTLSNNILLCSFFPCLPMYVDFNEKINDVLLSRTSDDCVLDKKARELLSLAYVIRNPWTIMSSKVENDETIIKYKEWSKSLKLINLCISITKKLVSGNIHCNIIDTNLQENRNAICEVYYREFDKYKCNVYSCGKYVVSQSVLDTLQNDVNYKIALSFESIINEIQKLIKMFKEIEIADNLIDRCITQFAQYAESYFLNDFITNIDTIDMLKTTNILSKRAKEIVVDCLHLAVRNPLKYANTYKKFEICLHKIQEKFNKEE